MVFLFDLIYLTLLALGSPWIFYRVGFLKKSRRGTLQRLLGRVPAAPDQRDRIWMHAVSVGEVQLLAPIIRELRQRNPNLAISISTTTESGYDVAVKLFPDLQVFFSPLDFSWAIRRVLRRLRPQAIVLVELELWPNMLRIASRKSIPVMVINGRLSDRSFQRYRWVSPLIRRMLQSVTRIAAQSPHYAERFLELGARPESLWITGNIKFDGAFDQRHRELGACLRKSFRLQAHEVIFVAGSTQPEEDLMAVEAYQRLSQVFSHLRMVVVPRHMHNLDSLLAVLKERKLPFVRRSQLGSTHTNDSRPIIVVDVMGELAGWWSLANIAYVGGSMGSRGGQNMIEPAANCAAVSFGPRTENFQDVVTLLLAHHAAVVVHNVQDFELFLHRAITDVRWRSEIGSKVRKLVEAQQGATARTCDLIEGLVQLPVSIETGKIGRAA